MENVTREKINAFTEQVAHINGVPSSTQKFNVIPTVQQTLESTMTESIGFLGDINVIPVTEQQGEKLGLGIGSTIASTTDTNNNDRVTQDPHNFTDKGYHCQQVNYDSHLRYVTLDMWAKFADFERRVRDALLIRQGLDRIMMGFNGTSRAADSDRVANPLLQDVAIGWLQKIRNDKPESVLEEDGQTAGKIVIGAGNKYETLDGLVFDLVNNNIESWYRNDPDLVVILGNQLMSDKYFPIVNKAQASTEVLAGQTIVSQKRVGNLPAVQVPFFPEDGLLVTRLDNLSIYYQEGKRRRNIVDNSKRDRIENYESSNDDFIVEDYGLATLAENIEFA